MKVLVVTWDGGGNRQPFEVIVAELVGRGDSVLVVSNEVHHEVFESLGATFSPLGVADKTLVSRPQLDQQLERLGEVVFSLVTPERVAAAVDAFSPEVTVVDVVMLSAQAAIERAGAPLVSLHHTLTAASWGGSRREQIEGSVGRVNRMRSDLGLDAVNHYQDVHAIPSAHIVPTAAALDAPAPWPIDLSYVGPLQPPSTGRIPGDLPPRFVLVSFSTTWQLQVEVLQRVIDALGQLDRPVVVTTGPSVDPAELRSAENTFIHAEVPHHRILDRTEAVVTHAGHGTVISALAAGVPLVCVPQGRDQFDVARQVDLTGTGIVVGSEFVPGDLCDSVRIVLDDARYRVAAAEMSKSIAGHGGVQEAVAIIDRCAQRS